MGTRMPLPAGPNLNPHARPVARPAPWTVLLFTGSCSGCSSSDPLAEWQRVAERFGDLRVCVVSQDSPRRAREFLQGAHYSMPLYVDTDGSLSRRYNVAWTPRAYALDPLGRLVWCEGPSPPEPPLVMARRLAASAEGAGR